jgi:hypothetical protein
MKILGTKVNIHFSFWMLAILFTLPGILAFNYTLLAQLVFSFFSLYLMVVIHEFAHILQPKN